MQLLSDSAERLWYRLLTAVDDFGRLEADPEVVFTTCFQRVPKGWTKEKVKGCLWELSRKAPEGDRPLIVIYEVGFRSFIQVLSAKSHIYQRAKESKYPPPTEDQLNSTVIKTVSQMSASAHKCPPIPSYPESRTPSPESRVPNSESRTTEADAASRFGEFWQIYPARGGKKVEKAATMALFIALSDEDQILAVQAARNYADSLAVQGISAKDPKRFLRDGKRHEPWRDWITPALTPTIGSAPQAKCQSVKDGPCQEYAILLSKYCQSHKEFYSKVRERMVTA